MSEHTIDGVRIARGAWLRTVGLIGARRRERLFLLIPRCRAVHTLGVLRTIDVVFLSEAGAIVAIRESLRPWRICVGPKTAVSALELPAGIARERTMAVGDTVVLT